MVDRLNMLMESRIHGDVYVRFGGEFLETYRSNTTRRRVLSLRLKAQYLFLFAGGLLTAFILFVILYTAGAGQWLCIGFGITAASAVVWLTFRLNAKYGEHGLMKLGAARMRPRYLIHRRRVFHLLRRKKKGGKT